MSISNFLPTTFAVCFGNCCGGRPFDLSIKYNKEKLINKIKNFNYAAADLFLFYYNTYCRFYFFQFHDPFFHHRDFPSACVVCRGSTERQCHLRDLLGMQFVLKKNNII